MSSKPVNHDTNDARLTFQTLGQATLCRVSADQGTVQVLPPGKPLAMLVYLAHAPGKSVSRDHLLDLLWAEHETAAAKHALRQAVWYIRKRIGDASLEVRKGMVSLTAELDLDTHRFVKAIENGDLERAVELYSGPFLPDLALPGGAEFERWACAERVRFESLLFRAAEIVTRRLNSEGQFRKAEKLARRLRDMAPLREAGWRLLLESLVSASDTVSAAVEAAELEQLLDAEGREPERATREAIRLAKQLPSNGTEAEKTQSLIAELVGREREFATIIGAWERAQTGTGCHIAVTAPAGLGKTRLLNDAAGRLRATGATVVHLRANQGERHVTYGFAGHLAKALVELPGAKGIAPACASTLVALNPSLSSYYDLSAETAKEPELLRRRVIALTELLTAVAHEQPVALQIDDVHWMDEASRSVVVGVASAVSDLHVIVVTASRPIQHGAVQEAAHEQITLPPLTEEQVGALVCSLGSLPDVTFADRLPAMLHSTTGGSPLLVMETLHLAIDRGTLELSDDGWSCTDETALARELEEGSALGHRVKRLDRAEDWLLLLLSTAGMPVSLARLVRMTNSSPESIQGGIASLEQRGFITRLGNDYEPAHDEITTLAVELASPKALSAANGTVGRVLADETWDDVSALTLAGQFLSEAKDDALLRSVFRRFVWLTRRRGDHRTLRELAAEILGHHAATERVAKLVRHLPLHMRLGLTSAKRIAATAAVIALTTITAGWWLALPEPPRPDAVFLAFIKHADAAEYSVFGAPLSLDAWTAAEPLEMSETPREAVPDVTARRDVIASPTGNRWATSMVVEDSGGAEVFVLNAGGGNTRLTFSPGDDKPESWSPDGRYLAIATARWHDESIYDIATIEVSTGVVTPLTRTDAEEARPHWSPDGTRIAFLTSTIPVAPKTLCWITADGQSKRCAGTAEYPVADLHGWTNRTDVLLSYDSAGTSVLASVDVNTGESRRLPDAHSARFSLSPNGRWAACLCDIHAQGLRRWHVFPTDRPELARPVAFPGGEVHPYAVSWLSSVPNTNYLERVVIQEPENAIPVGVPYYLQAKGLDSDGSALPLRSLSWTSRDAAVAVVSDSGLLLPVRIGTVNIVASAGGWRQDSLRITIGPQWSRPLMDEDWSDSLNENWRTFGDPTPSVSIGPDSMLVFDSNADGSYHSGAYMRHNLESTSGFGVETILSTPVTRHHQQILSLVLAPWLDSAAVESWNHQTGGRPGRGDSPSCIVQHPVTYAVNAGALYVRQGNNQTLIDVSPHPGSGEWYRVRLQMFPDGTCGVAYNGVPVDRSPYTFALDVPYRVVLEAKSVNTKMLVGPVEVWEGVRTDVDWGALEESR